MCDSNKNKYLEKLNFYNSINNNYKINKYNYKLSQIGSALSDDEKKNLTNIIKTFLNKNIKLRYLICNDNNNINKYDDIVTGNDKIIEKLIKCYNYNSNNFKFNMREEIEGNDKKYTIIKNKNNYEIKDYIKKK